jgi:site-specific recombinase XerC
MTNELTLTTVQQGDGLLHAEAAEGRADRNAAAVYLAGLRPSTRATMRRALNTIALLLAGETAAGWPEDGYLGVPWARMRFQHTDAVRAALAERYAPATANLHLSALRGVLRTAWRLGQMTADDFQRAADLGAVKGERLPAGRAVATGELSALLGTCGQDVGGIRDAAVIAVLYAGGLRRAELVGLDMASYETTADGARLVVLGKGNKQRAVPLAGGAARALGDWLAVRGDAAGPLFYVVGNRNRGGRMTSQAVYAMLKARAAAAGVASLSPHDLRRTFVGDLLDAGADIATVQRLAGHASPATTARYDRRGEAVKRAAVDRLHVPYTRRVLAE